MTDHTALILVTAWGFIATILLGLITWIWKNTISRLAAAEKDIRLLQLTAAQTVSQAELRAHMKEEQEVLEKYMDRILHQFQGLQEHMQSLHAVVHQMELRIAPLSQGQRK